MDTKLWGGRGCVGGREGGKKKSIKYIKKNKLKKERKNKTELRNKGLNEVGTIRAKEVSLENQYTGPWQAWDLVHLRNPTDQCNEYSKEEQTAWMSLIGQDTVAEGFVGEFLLVLGMAFREARFHTW
uniref:Uncharacterized protein n=1 Tax=Pipistrellus kuhlii TaxID=59472 RepID=A0A7J7V0P0_PIPKU|nr:hypothetical protein mPipKuh1_008630 [Pipistrellus kuhlii]